MSKSFPRRDGGPAFEAVRDLSFAVGRGELVAILGKTGCGKSTTFNLISGLIRPSHGRVAVQGHDPYADFAWFRGKIGIVFQNDRLMPWRTAIDNVALGLELNKVPPAQRREIAASWLDAAWALPATRTIIRMRCPAACASASRSPAPLPASRTSFYATSRSPRSTSTPAMRCAEEFRELLRQTGATAIFITHSIEEALWLGARLMVFERPARIAYETVLRAEMSEAEREAVRGRIREVLSGEVAASAP